MFKILIKTGIFSAYIDDLESSIYQIFFHYYKHRVQVGILNNLIQAQVVLTALTEDSGEAVLR